MTGNAAGVECSADPERLAATDTIDGRRWNIEQRAADAGRLQAETVQQRPRYRAARTIGELVERCSLPEFRAVDLRRSVLDRLRRKETGGNAPPYWRWLHAKKLEMVKAVALAAAGKRPVVAQARERLDQIPTLPASKRAQRRALKPNGRPSI